MILVSLAPTERPVAGYVGPGLRREGAKVNKCNGMDSPGPDQEMQRVFPVSVALGHRPKLAHVSA